MQLSSPERTKCACEQGQVFIRQRSVQFSGSQDVILQQMLWGKSTTNPEVNQLKVSTARTANKLFASAGKHKL